MAETITCEICFALVATSKLDRHLDWHRITTQVVEPARRYVQPESMGK